MKEEDREKLLRFIYGEAQIWLFDHNGQIELGWNEIRAIDFNDWLAQFPSLHDHDMVSAMQVFKEWVTRDFDVSLPP